MKSKSDETLFHTGWYAFINGNILGIVGIKYGAITNYMFHIIYVLFGMHLNICWYTSNLSCFMYFYAF